jgi:hypothetical protein
MPIKFNKGLDLVIADGMTAEAMVVFTSGTFLNRHGHPIRRHQFPVRGCLPRCPHLLLFSSCFRSGWSAGSITAGSSRRCLTFWRGYRSWLSVMMPFLFTKGTSIEVLFILLFFQHIFGDIAGASWNSWMKDLVPAGQMGAFFSRRTRMSQALNVTLSLATAFAIDYVKAH